MVFFSFPPNDDCRRRYSADECTIDTGRKAVTFDLYDKKLSESINDVHKKYHEITVYENSSVEGKYTLYYALYLPTLVVKRSF